MFLSHKLFDLLKPKPISLVTKDRRIWQWLNVIFNKPDEQRIKAVGPDRAAAEWLLKNGASVKWTASQDWVSDYNSLPAEEMTKEVKIKEIDATDSSISHIGFDHLKGLTQLEKVIIKNNGYIEDKALEMLAICSDTLGHLEIISCIGVTDKGVVSLTQLKKLHYLKLFDLPSVKDRDGCIERLRTGLKCRIHWDLVNTKMF